MGWLEGLVSDHGFIRLPLPPPGGIGLVSREWGWVVLARVEQVGASSSVG